MPTYFGQEFTSEPGAVFIRPPGGWNSRLYKSRSYWQLVTDFRTLALQALKDGVMIDPEDLLAVLDGTEDQP